MAGGEFDAAIREAVPAVAVVLSQSWCPQWLWMKHYLDALGSEPGIAVYWIEYDKESFFAEFLRFKEETFDNRQIPYVRYYRQGRFVRDSNYIDKNGFMRALGAGPEQGSGRAREQQ